MSKYKIILKNIGVPDRFGNVFTEASFNNMPKKLPIRFGKGVYGVIDNIRIEAGVVVGDVEHITDVSDLVEQCELSLGNKPFWTPDSDSMIFNDE